MIISSNSISNVDVPIKWPKEEEEGESRQGKLSKSRFKDCARSVSIRCARHVNSFVGSVASTSAVIASYNARAASHFYVEVANAAVKVLIASDLQF